MIGERLYIVHVYVVVVSEPYDPNAGDEYECGEGGYADEEEEVVFVVAFAYACSYPGTVALRRM